MVIEGNLCHAMYHGSCSCCELLPWLLLAVDLDTSVTVKRVEISNRDDCCGDRARKVDLRVASFLLLAARCFLEAFSCPLCGTCDNLRSKDDTCCQLEIVFNQGKPGLVGMSPSKWKIVTAFHSTSGNDGFWGNRCFFLQFWAYWSKRPKYTKFINYEAHISSILSQTPRDIKQ